jgi:hypothetical protein
VGEISSKPELFDDATDLDDNNLGLAIQHDPLDLRTGSNKGFDERMTEQPEVVLEEPEFDAVSLPITQADCAPPGLLDDDLVGNPVVLNDSEPEDDGDAVAGDCFVDHYPILKTPGPVQGQGLAESSKGWTNKNVDSQNGTDTLDDSKGWSGFFKNARTMGNLKFFPPNKGIKPSSTLLIQL